MKEYICPHCKNPIYDEEALLCHFCGGSLNRASRGLFGKMTRASAKGFFVFVALLVIGGFLFLLLR